MEYLDNSRRQWQQMEMREEVIQSQHQQCITMDLLGMHSFAGSNTIAPQSSSATLQANKTRKEQMFEKAVTPSDVGKLNRLVIPKQHAEKHFPLDTQAQEKGLLLSFEESTGSGKSWKFRYSYWNSSQSYVLTKGWSRFVKEKNLHAGDIVCFEREYAGESSHKLFISWRRRPKLHTPLDVRKRLNLPPFFNQTSNLFYHHQHQQQFPLPLLRSSPFNFDNNNNPNLCHATSYHPRWISPETKDILPSNPLRGFPISDFHLLSATATNASSSDVTSVVNNTEINKSVDMLSPHHGSLSKKGVRLFGVDLACSDGQKDGSKNVHVKSSIQEHLAPCKYQVLQSSPTSPHMQHQL